MQCVRVGARACVRAWGERERPNAPLYIWFSHHHCGEITLSIVGYVGIPSACNISLSHMSPQIVKKHPGRLH